MKFASVNEWLDWQTKIHNQSIDMGLDRIRPVYERLINHSVANHIILVGGTNGKGSTAAFLESVYVAAGYQVAVYSSPHLLRYNERIRINGEPVSDEILCESFQRVETARQGVSLTYFEFGTLAAFDVFLQNSPDVAILEIGLGGRLDAVNLVEPDVSIVTNIALDHTDWLGDSREKIAKEKLAIGRKNKTLFLADDNPPENTASFCRDLGIDIKLIGKDFGFVINNQEWLWWAGDKKKFGLNEPGLKGLHQYKNASVALAAADDLSESLPLSMNHIRVGLARCQLPGRFQMISDKDKTIILDVAHNPESVKSFLNNLKKLPRLGEHHLIFAMLEDKASDEIITLLRDHIDRWILAGLDVPRGMSASQLEQKLIDNNIQPEQIISFDTVEDAYRETVKQVTSPDKLIVLGSFYTVSAVLPLLENC